MILPTTNQTVTFDTQLHGNAMEKLTDHEAQQLAIAVELLAGNPRYHNVEEREPRLKRADAWIRQGKVIDHHDGTYTVQGSKPGTSYTLTGEHCTCEHATKGRSQVCYHATAVKLYQEWQRRLTPLGAPATPLCTQPALPGAPQHWAGLCHHPAYRDGRCETHHTLYQTTQEPQDATVPPAVKDISSMSEHAPIEPLEPSAPIRPAIPREHVVTIQGKQHVLYTGLLTMAQQMGLVSLTSEWTYNDADLSLARAIAVFSDGRQYTEAGDAAPDSVSKGLVKSFRRIALTRAKARCLRDALAISECAVEELPDDSPAERPTVDMTRPVAASLRLQIVALVRELGHTARTREDYERIVVAQTGYTLVESNYGAIVKALEAARDAA